MGFQVHIEGNSRYGVRGIPGTVHNEGDSRYTVKETPGTQLGELLVHSKGDSRYTVRENSRYREKGTQLTQDGSV